jgi:asparagine synthase (glutamine-hydrolysing)
MCGIAGALDLGGRDVDGELIGRMTRRLAHRGPDGEGTWSGGPVAFGHTRLSLLDLAGGAQPMGNEDGRVMVAFNGEIYNFAPLKRELESRGHRFRTRSDTEVIPHAWEEWGAGAVERLRGMFAFALWDGRSRTLTLARDRLGVKPLYYALDGERLLFGSELKSILASGLVARRLDAEALHDYLSLLVPLAPRTMYADVRALEPGAMLTVKDGQATLQRYYTPRIAPDPSLSEARALDELEARLDETLRDQVVADVPVGAFLSGGIDSSLLVAHLARLGRSPLETFTIGFDDHESDESPFARCVARRFRTRHHELRVGAARAADPAVVEQVLDHFDQPFGDSSAIPTWLVSRETRRHVKTVISGDGGDELFGGYTAYRVAAVLARLARLPPGARRAVQAVAAAARAVGARETARRLDKALAIAGLAPGEALCALRSYFDEEAKARLYRPEHARRLVGYRTADRFADDAAREGERDLPTALAGCDLRHRLAGDMLCKVDMMSMSHGLEVRVPLLDERVVELALRLPPDLRVRGATTKYLLRQAARRRLPGVVAEKPKGGFVIPLRRAAGAALDRLVDETIARPTARLAEVLRPEALRRYARAWKTGRPPEGCSRWQLEQRVYALCALERWMARTGVHP